MAENMLTELLQNKAVTIEIKQILRTIWDVCFMEMYPYIYIFVILFIIVILLHLASLILIIRHYYTH